MWARWLFVLLLLWPIELQATNYQFCGPRDTFIKQLENTYKESQTGIGLVSSGSIIELFTSEEGSWTILTTNPNGRTCVIGSGEGWQSSDSPAGSEM